jgi:hypothetical protein
VVQASSLLTSDETISLNEIKLSMVIKLGVREAIKNFNDLDSKLNLSQTEEDRFFPE